MPRGLSTAQKDTIAARVHGLAYFVHLDLATGSDVRVWNGLGTISVLGQTWDGLGELGIIDGLEGDLSLKAQELSLTCAGIPGDALTPGIVQATRSQRYQGRPLTVYMGIYDANNVLVGNPFVIWSGEADVLTFQIGSTASVNLTGQHLDSHMRRTNGWNMTTISHNARFGLADNSDLFFEPTDRLMGVPRPVVG